MKLSGIAKGVIAAQLTFSPISYAAQSGLITFMGSVAVATCEKKIAVNDSANPTNQIEFGALNNKQPETPIHFTVTSKGIGGGKCMAPEIAEVSWSSPAMSYRGLENLSGTAEGTYLQLMAAYQGKEKSIDKENYKITYPKPELISEGIDFYATIHRGEGVGSFNTIATVSIVYH